MTKEHVYWAAIAMLLFLFVFLQLRYEHERQKNSQLNTVISEKNDSLHYHRNEQGRLIAEKVAAEVRYQDLQKAYPEIAESIRKEFDLKLKDVKVFIRNEFAARGEGKGSVVTNNYYDSTTHRTIRFKDFSMDDGYLKFDTRLYDSLSSALYSYIYSDTSNTVVHSKKKWLFGKEQLYSSTMFSNPNAKVVNSTNVLINNYRDKRFNISIGVYGDPFRMTWGPAVTVGYSLIKF